MGVPNTGVFKLKPREWPRRSVASLRNCAFFTTRASRKTPAFRSVVPSAFKVTVQRGDVNAREGG